MQQHFKLVLGHHQVLNFASLPSWQAVVDLLLFLLPQRNRPACQQQQMGVCSLQHHHHHTLRSQ